jgi:ribosome-binding protein aMBF1 (putative translation factor)
MKVKTVDSRELLANWREDPEFRTAYDELEEEFAVIRAVLEARTRAGISQAELARRMGTTQSAIARLEAGKVKPSTGTLEKVAKATGTRLRVSFEPRDAAA